MKKRLCSFLLALILLLTLIPTTAHAVNTDYDGYATTIAEAGAQLRAGMKSRQKSVIVRFSTTGKKTNPAATVYQEAIKHTGVPTEGDYLRFQCDGWSADIGHVTEGNRIYYTIYYNMRYYTTATQEKAVNDKVSKILGSLSLKNASDYKKARLIYDYICRNVAYDYAHSSNKNYMLKYACYGALVNNTAVCQGYALAFYRLALECGLDCRLIIGTGNNNSHSWNIVKVNGKYYHVDPTWDAGRSSYAYFLKGSSYTGHYRNSEYSSSAFCRAYPVSSTSYAAGSGTKTAAAPQSLAKLAISSLTNTKDGITVKWKKVAGASGYQIYRKIGSGDWKLAKTISGGSVTSWTNTGRTSGNKYQYKIRATAGSVKSSYSAAKTRYFVAQPTVTLSNNTKGITVNWKKVTGATGYQIYRKSGSEWKLIKTVSGGSVTSWTNTGRTNGTTYQYRVAAIKKVGDVTHKSDYSTAKKLCRLNTPTVSSLKNSGAAQLTVKWDKNTKAAGYQVKYTVGDITKTVKIKGAASLSKTVQKLKKGETYEVSVRSYKTVSGTTYYSAYSAVKSVKVAK